MTTIAILPEIPGSADSGFRAVTGKKQAVGKTAGEALDALASQLDDEERGTLIVVQHLRPDNFFNAEQQQRLQTLMARWRSARDQKIALSIDEQAELESLNDELQAAAARAASLAGEP